MLDPRCALVAGIVGIRFSGLANVVSYITRFSAATSCAFDEVKIKSPNKILTTFFHPTRPLFGVHSSLKHPNKEKVLIYSVCLREGSWTLKRTIFVNKFSIIIRMHPIEPWILINHHEKIVVIDIHSGKVIQTIRYAHNLYLEDFHVQFPLCAVLSRAVLHVHNFSTNQSYKHESDNFFGALQFHRTLPILGALGDGSLFVIDFSCKDTFECLQETEVPLRKLVDLFVFDARRPWVYLFNHIGWSVVNYRTAEVLSTISLCHPSWEGALSTAWMQLCISRIHENQIVIKGSNTVHFQFVESKEIIHVWDGVQLCMSHKYGMVASWNSKSVTITPYLRPTTSNSTL